jgi:hypothetical protein
MPHKKTLEELKREAIGKLERRGYDVRGKTPAQIRQMLRPRPTKTKSNAKPLGVGISDDR